MIFRYKNFSPEGPPPPMDDSDSGGSGGGGHLDLPGTGGASGSGVRKKGSDEGKRPGDDGIMPLDSPPNNTVWGQLVVSQALGYNPLEGTGRNMDGSYNTEDSIPKDGVEAQGDNNFASAANALSFAPVQDKLKNPPPKGGNDPYAGKGSF
jgi:hypothetical protein